MPADSSARRLAKRVLSPLLNDTTYGWAHAASVARDIRAGRYAEPELDLVPLTLRAGETALDLGANLGWYVEAMSRASAPRGRVYAFEPIPYTVATLRKVVKLLRLRNIEVVSKACGAEAARVAFEVPLQESGAYSTGQAYMQRRNDDHPGKEEQVRWSETESVEVDVIALDAYVPPAAEVALIKADIEGAELLAFEGAAVLIERHRPTVICEINPWFLDGFGIGTAELVSFFADRGYSLYRYRDRDRRLEAIADIGAIVEDNYVFVHPSRRGRLKSKLDLAGVSGT